MPSCVKTSPFQYVENLNHSYICAQVHYFFALMAKLILKQVCSVMGDMTAQMDQMNFNALLVNVTFKSDFFMKKVFLYNQEKVFSGKKSYQKKRKKNLFYTLLHEFETRSKLFQSVSYLPKSFSRISYLEF